MKLQNYIETLENSSEFSVFKKNNPDAFIMAVFTTIGNSDTPEKMQIDYCIPPKNTVAAFSIPDNHCTTYNEPMKEAKEQTTDITIDLDTIKEHITRSIAKNDLSFKPTKIIAILTNDIWNITLLDAAANMLNIKINAKTEQELECKKMHMSDFMQVNKK